MSTRHLQQLFNESKRLCGQIPRAFEQAVERRDPTAQDRLKKAAVHAVDRMLRRGRKLTESMREPLVTSDRKRSDDQ